MKYTTIIWIIFAILIIIFFITKKNTNKKLNTIVIILFVFLLLAQTILPRQFFFKWNSISKLNGKEITKVILQPSAPAWEVNLTSLNKSIYDKNQIDSLVYLLQRAEVYFPSHPSRIWETKIIFITSLNDSLEIEINKTSNDWTIIHTPTNEWRKDEIGYFLEKITQYKKPLLADTAIHTIYNQPK